MEMHFAERRKYAGQIDRSPSQLDKLVGRRRLANRTTHILYVQEQQAVGVTPDRGHGIAAAHLIVRDVEQQFDVLRVRSVEHVLDLVRPLADAPHVRMIGDWNPDLGGALADLREELTTSLR